jgi:hypothetical protein
MALRLGRWKTSDPSFPFGAKPGAFVRSIDEGELPRARTRDAMARRPGWVRGDQAPAPGELVCRLSQNGQSGERAAEDANGNPLVIRPGANGQYEILRPGNGNGDAHAGAPGELQMTDPLAADQRRITAQIAPGHGVDAPDQRTPAGLRRLQTLLDRTYARR